MFINHEPPLRILHLFHLILHTNFLQKACADGQATLPEGANPELQELNEKVNQFLPMICGEEEEGS